MELTLTLNDAEAQALGGLLLWVPRQHDQVNEAGQRIVGSGVQAEAAILSLRQKLDAALVQASQPAPEPVVAAVAENGAKPQGASRAERRRSKKAKA